MLTINLRSFHFLRKSSVSFVCFISACLSLSAFTVDTGSDGSMGELIVETDTAVDVPADGILKYTRVQINEGAKLWFRSDSSVHILATEEIVVNGIIDVSGHDASEYTGGAGGPGGWSGGSSGDSSGVGGAGGGPGGGVYYSNYGVPGAYATKGRNAGIYSSYYGSIYGSPLLFPLIGGSGGGGSQISGGGGGGGAVMLASNRSIQIGETGKVLAMGGASGTPEGQNSYSYANGGSGGGIRLLAPEVIVNGEVNSSGFYYSDYCYSGNGYVRIDSGLYLLGENSIVKGYVSAGKNHMVFPESTPRLTILNVAGTDINSDQQGEIYVSLLPNGQTTQPVTIEASGFNCEVALEIMVAPLDADSKGDRLVTEVTLDNTLSNPVRGSFDVQFPQGVTSQVFVYTKGSLR